MIDGEADGFVALYTHNGVIVGATFVLPSRASPFRSVQARNVKPSPLHMTRSRAIITLCSLLALRIGGVLAT